MIVHSPTRSPLMPPTLAEPFAVWHKRPWKDLQLSASQTNCQLCVADVAMIQYAAQGAEIASTVPITSKFYVGRPCLMPSQLMFEVRGSHKLDLHLGISVRIDDDNTGESALCYDLPLVGSWLGTFHDLHPSVGDILSPTRIPSGIWTEDQTCIEFLSQSLAYCLSNHASCASRKENTWVPKRLLDIGLLPPHSDSIVLVEKDDIEKSIREHVVRYFGLQ